MSDPCLTSLRASSRPSSQSRHRTLRSSVVPRSLWQISRAFVGWKHDELMTEQPRSIIQSRVDIKNWAGIFTTSGVIWHFHSWLRQKAKIIIPNYLLPPITRDIFNSTQLGDDMVGEDTHVALQHPFVSLRTPASESMRSHRRPALHRCNAHCCKGCRARSFYCHPWSGQSTNLNKSSYARVTCRCPKVAMLMHSRLLHGVLLQYVLWF